MIRIADNTPDGSISASLDTVTDDEGTVIPCSLVDPTSDNESAFAFQNVTNSGSSMSAGYHVGSPKEDGSPAQATIKFAVKRNDTGAEIASQSYVVEVSAGAPTNVPLTINLGDLVDDEATA